MSAWIAVAIFIAPAFLFALLFAFGLCRAAARPTPAPPARPRLRVIQSRENVGVVEFLPDRGDDR